MVLFYNNATFSIIFSFYHFIIAWFYNANKITRELYNILFNCIIINERFITFEILSGGLNI